MQPFTRTKLSWGSAPTRLLRMDEALTVLRAVRRPHDTALFHHFDDLSSPVVANGHLPLQPAGRATLGLGDDPHGLVVASVQRLLASSLFLLVLGSLQNCVVVFGRAL